VAGAQGRKAATRHQSGSLVFGRPILRAIALTVFTVRVHDLAGGLAVAWRPRSLPLLSGDAGLVVMRQVTYS
jgi:hypothetical protein